MKKIVSVPCFNEEDTIEMTLNTLLDYSSTLDNSFDILIVNDGSNDKTEKILTKFKDQVEILNSSLNFGLVEVFNSIINYSLEHNYDQLVIFDADLQYPYDEIEKLFLELSQQNADIVIGVREFKKINHFSNIKKLLQILGSKIVSFLVGYKISDVTSGFRSYNLKRINDLICIGSFTYTLESLFVAKKYNLSIGTMKISYINETRESRLFKTNFDYIKKTLAQIIEVLIFHTRIVKRSILLSAIPGFYLISRFLFKYIMEGSNSGNIQSLVVGMNLLIIVLVLFVSLYIVTFLKNLKYENYIKFYSRKHF